FNADVHSRDGGPTPDLVVCDHDCLDGASDVTARSLVPGWDPDFICDFDYVQTAFVASRALTEAQHGERPASLHDWLCRIARRAQQPATRHVAEPLVHMPAGAAQPTPRRAPPLRPPR